MHDYLDIFLPDLLAYIGRILDYLLQIDIIGLLVGIIFAFIIIKAIFRIITG